MEPQSRSGTGRHNSTRSTLSRPTSRGVANNAAHIDTSTALGQLAFAPATQTTVVTTTTTTTTKFPPFAIRPPRRLQDLDVKHYPLAATPTPASLRKITFLVDGKQAIFEEADDANLALKMLGDEIQMLESSNGTIRKMRTYDSRAISGFENRSERLGEGLLIAPDRPVSPESITEIDEAEEISPSLRSRLEPGNETGGHEKRTRRSASMQNSHLRSVLAHSPLTPSAGPSRSSRQIRQDVRQALDNTLISPEVEQQRTPHSKQSRSLTAHTRMQSNLGKSYPPSADLLPEERKDTQMTRCGESHVHLEGAVPTPPIDRDDMQVFIRPSSRRTATSIPSRLNVVDSPNLQDGSLPSPSLSPVTAAATTHNAGYFADVDSNSEMNSPYDYDVSENESSFPVLRGSSFSFPTPAVNDTTKQIESHFNGTSMAEIPAMLDFFEAIPDDLKTYVMHQLLRRCPKATLHTVAEVVNPTLKKDFLADLPIELGLNVVRFLDVRSLCRASQVSKKWRQMTNTAEKAWKDLFDADGLVLSENDLHRAIVEGWGWQDPYGIDGYESNLALDARAPSRSGSDISTATSRPTSSVELRRSKRSKRKAVSDQFRSRKQMKRSDTVRAAEHDEVEFMVDLSSREGPHHAANAAIVAVPHPNVGLPALKGMHLYKSLYRRHHLIRRNWMHEDTQPHHIAFRAHDSHVVTCLQFDTDKILTGSDDNNINVYDTKTGELRTKLVGHEGGVWALQYEGNTLVSGSTDRSVRVWDIARGKETQVFRGHTSTVRCLQIVMPTKVGETADGKALMMPKHPLIITGSRDSNLRVWRLPQPGDKVFIQTDDEEDCPYFVRALTGHQHSVRAIAAHADTLVSGSYDCSVRVWKISTGETVHRLTGHAQKVYSVVLDHERNRCISGSMDNMVKIWDLDHGSLSHTLDGHTSLVGLLDLNCGRLVSAAADSSLRIWDPETGQCKSTLTAHTGAITCFQHDGQKVISGSDRTLKMWNIKTGECMKDLLSDLSGVWQVKFNERRCVAAVQRDNMTYIEVLDFGASRDGVPDSALGRRTVVDAEGMEIVEYEEGYMGLDGEVEV